MIQDTKVSKSIEELQKEAARTRFKELYKGGTPFEVAARMVQTETGFQTIIPGKSAFFGDTIDRIVWCWAADLDGWEVAGIVGGAFLTICPRCHDMESLDNIFVHRQWHKERGTW